MNTLNNKRNNYGLKDSSNTYLKAGTYKQWSDEAATIEDAKRIIEESQKDYPDYKFIIRKQKGFYRVYYQS